MIDITQPLSRSEVMRFLGAKAPKAKCQCCGCNRFSLIDENKGTGAGEARAAHLLFKFPGYEVTSANTVPVVMLVCDECANVWEFLRCQIIEWLNENPSEVSPSG